MHSWLWVFFEAQSQWVGGWSPPNLSAVTMQLSIATFLHFVWVSKDNMNKMFTFWVIENSFQILPLELLAVDWLISHINFCLVCKHHTAPNTHSIKWMFASDFSVNNYYSYRAMLCMNRLLILSLIAGVATDLSNCWSCAVITLRSAAYHCVIIALSLQTRWRQWW